MTPTTPKEWREKRARGIEITLPEYDDVVFIRPMDAELFFKQGRVPDFFAKTVRQIIGSEKVEWPVISGAEDEQTRDWLQWLDELVKYAFVSPKVVDTPQNDDEIGIDEIAYADKVFVYRLFGQPAQVLRKFRRKSSESVAPVDTTEANESSTIEGNAD